MTFGDYVFLTIMGIGLLACLAGVIYAVDRGGFHDGCRATMQEAIERGYAEYDTKTGVLKWKGDVQK